MQTMLTQKINLKDICLSLCETHHICNGVPLYKERYKKVLSYHKTTRFQDGIAPVFIEKDGKEEAFFIDTQGKGVFQKSFFKAFGFYEDLAAVSDESGFYHINDSGEEAYNNRFAWCGNFVNGACVVRDKSGLYFHIDAQGKALYGHRFSYVGDFVYNIAVAVLENGKATHICKDGTFLHGKLFESLEPYHKGVAVAKDSLGYFHIDKNGKALYADRFTKLEPFYNGRAFATTLCGKQCILNEKDYSLEVLESNPNGWVQDLGCEKWDIESKQNLDSIKDISCLRTQYDKNMESNGIKDKTSIAYQRYFSKLAFSFMSLQILRSVFELGVLESLQDKDSNKGFKTQGYSQTLLIDWLLQNGFIYKSTQSSYILTAKGQEALRLKNVFLYWLDLPYLVAHKLPESLRENKEMFSSIFNAGYFDMLHKDSKQQELFSAMAHFYASDYSDFMPILHNEVVCDIGCGSGALLDSIVKKYPNIHAIYADKTDLRMNKSGVFIEIDFFVPFSIQADVFIMSRILHDYDDCKAIKILQNVAKSMTKESRLYIIESLQDEKKQDIEVKVHLLNFLGGMERSLMEYESIVSKSGLKIVGVTKLQGIMSAMEIRKEQNEKHICKYE
ncbi:methyltransferase [Helicobacter bilis]|uniref:methyltransferase n=1 Tax=Helicobacter bilis TaxID=37372 RepID=UPI00248E2F2B|nr:methyltransferase [Helicobacter bilis]